MRYVDLPIKTLTALALAAAAAWAQAARGPGQPAEPAQAAVDRIDLEAAFLAPPVACRPWAYWWWLNANVTKESITRDLEGMIREKLAPPAPEPIEAADADAKPADEIQPGQKPEAKPAAPAAKPPAKGKAPEVPGLLSSFSLLGLLG